MYYKQGRVKKVLDVARSLIQKSKTSPEGSESNNNNDLAVPRLTTGGIITLERTLAKLQGLLDSYQD
jgi:ubiquitin-conjugating enzyme E2 O